jgi:hypothetical protein
MHACGSLRIKLQSMSAFLARTMLISVLMALHALHASLPAAADLRSCAAWLETASQVSARQAEFLQHTVTGSQSQ